MNRDSIFENKMFTTVVPLNNIIYKEFGVENFLLL